MGILPSHTSKGRAGARRQAWAAGLDPGYYVIDIDGTLVTAHSDKEGAAPTYKRGFGFYPLLAFLDATGDRSRAFCGPATPGRGPPRTTSPSWMPR